MSVFNEEASHSVIVFTRSFSLAHPPYQHFCAARVYLNLFRLCRVFIRDKALGGRCVQKSTLNGRCVQRGNEHLES